MCSVERNKKEYTKAILGSLGLVGEAYQVKSVGVARFLSLINRHLVIHHILLHGKTLWGITMLQRLQANSHQLAILHAVLILQGMTV